MLGGEQRNMTIMFSDVRGFTTISEIYKDDPQGLTSLMNNFLTPLTNAIIDRKGTIDKYMGDAIMAFWNAPLHDDSHEINACRSGYRNAGSALETLNRARAKEAESNGKSFIPIHIGIGINTGQCVVGNMGSDLRFDYSVLGDSVNLASRLEGQSKTYGVTTVIGSKTAQAARDRFALLELDFITVKGKTEPETIYTILGGEDVLRGSRFQELHQIFNEMLTRYRQQDFSGAEEAIARCRPLGDDFGLGHLFEIYAERIDGFRNDPPPADWNGVFHLHTK